jgi:hypothetical protein
MTNLRVLLYGEFGTWKTVTALRHDSNARIYATDDGWISAKNHPDWIKLEDVEVIPFEGRSQLLAEDFSSHHTSYVLDTASEMVEEYLDLLMNSAKWGNNFREKIATNNKELKDTEAPAAADYHVIRNKWRPVANHWLKADADIFILCHENDPIPGLSKNDTKMPNLPSKTFKAFAQKCHVIGRMTKQPGGGTIKVDVREDNARIVAKSRIGSIRGLMTVDKFVEELRKFKDE